MNTLNPTCLCLLKFCVIEADSNYIILNSFLFPFLHTILHTRTHFDHHSKINLKTTSHERISMLMLTFQSLFIT
jgi:hypothetical protein